MRPTPARSPHSDLSLPFLSRHQRAECALPVPEGATANPVDAQLDDMCSDLEERILIKAQRRKLRAAGIVPPYAAHSTKPVVSIPKREREAKQTEVQSKGVVHKSRSSSRSRSPGSRSSAAAAHEREREQRWMSPTHSPSKSSSHRAKNYGRARQAVIQAAAEAARDVAAEEPAVPTEQHFAVGSPAYALRNALQKSLLSSSSSSLRWASWAA